MTTIDGVLLTSEKRISHPKGDLLHILRCNSEGFEKLGEAYFSFIKRNEIKGWKIHDRVSCNLVCPKGAVKFVLYDDRPLSPTQGKFFECVLPGDGPGHLRLTIPPGVWFAFCGILEENLLLNIISEIHDPAEGRALPLESIKYDW